MHHGWVPTSNAIFLFLKMLHSLPELFFPKRLDSPFTKLCHWTISGHFQNKSRVKSSRVMLNKLSSTRVVEWGQVKQHNMKGFEGLVYVS